TGKYVVVGLARDGGRAVAGNERVEGIQVVLVVKLGFPSRGPGPQFPIERCTGRPLQDVLGAENVQRQGRRDQTRQKLKIPGAVDRDTTLTETLRLPTIVECDIQCLDLVFGEIELSLIHPNDRANAKALRIVLRCRCSAKDQAIDEELIVDEVLTDEKLRDV